jgi:hypothetical protein
MKTHLQNSSSLPTPIQHRHYNSPRERLIWVHPVADMGSQSKIQHQESSIRHLPSSAVHLLLGFIIGAAINLAVQLAGSDSALRMFGQTGSVQSAFTSGLDLLELFACASVAALAAFTAARASDKCRVTSDESTSHRVENPVS